MGAIVRLKIWILYCLFFILILFIYKYYIFPIWSYEGFIWKLNFYKFIISFTLLTIITLILPSKFKKPSDILLHLQFLFPIFFMLVLYPIEDLSTSYMIFSILSFLLIMGIAKIKSPVPFLKIIHLKWKTVFLFLFSVGLSLFILLAITHKEFFSLNLAKVYEYRLLLRDIDTGIWGYLWFGIFPLVASLFLSFTLIKKKKMLVIIISIIFILIFGLTSHKQFLFLPVATGGLYFILTREKPLFWILGSLISLSLLCVLLDFFWFKVWATSLVIHRIFLVPAQLNFFYFDFFSQHPKVFWTDSKWLMLDKILDYPYDLPMPMVIGYEYFNNPQTNANTGWLGSGYAHAGYFGMIIYAIIIGFILKYLNYKARTFGTLFIVISFSPFISSLFFSSDLKTVFLTHGLIFYLFLLSTIKQLP